MTLQDLYDKQLSAGYFNLHLLHEWQPDGKSDTREKTEMPTEEQNPPPNPMIKYFDVLERFGKFPVKYDGRMDRYKPALDINGNPAAGAEWLEMIITMIVMNKGNYAAEKIQRCIKRQIRICCHCGINQWAEFQFCSH